MRIIGHRGAAGLELENSRSSIKKAKELGVDGIEIDVHLTKDGHLVLCHDADLSRVSSSNAKISSLTLAELKKIKLNNGETVPTLKEALKITGSTWTIIEIKQNGCAEELLNTLEDFPNSNVTIASFHHNFARELENKAPELSVFLAEKTRPTEIIRIVRTAKADGLDLNAWLLNPLTYWLAKRHNLDIMVFTINSPFIARFIHLLYPDVAICTDRPDRLLHLRKI